MKFFSILAVIFLLLSCSKEADKEQNAERKPTETISDTFIDADTIFSFADYSKVGYSNPERKVELRIKNRGYGDCKVAIVVYGNRFGDTTDATPFLLSQIGEPESIEFVQNNDEDYIYIGLLIPGGSLGNFGHTCLLVNIKTREEFYYQVDNFPDGYFVRTTIVNNSNNFALEAFPASYLSKKLGKVLQSLAFTEAEQSRYDFYLDNIKNNSLSSTKKMKFRKTKSKLFDTKPEPKDKIGSSINARAENSRYIVTSFFREATYCYDKKTKEFFCLWAPSSIYHNAESISFTNDHTVEIIGDGHNISINLLTGVWEEVEDTELICNE